MARWAGTYASLVTSVGEARALADRFLGQPLPRRWSHVNAVGEKAESLQDAFDASDGLTLTAAAWLHDIGYSPGLVNTGLHGLDGAWWLRSQGVDERICSLVAHHSCAQLEAEERGLGDVLACEFNRESSPVADALCYADMTTGPDGQDLDVHDRLAEIRSRYGPDDVVTRFIIRAEPVIVGAVERTELRLGAHGSLNRCKDHHHGHSRG
jgi:hypothetical protein